ncbi:MAG TPA: hypothetical protein PK269_07590 [Bacteroidales bacterium]|nr:hypothetical protein [Bacteroidales bacterium]
MKFLEKEDSKPTAKHIVRSHVPPLKPKPVKELVFLQTLTLPTKN